MKKIIFFLSLFYWSIGFSQLAETKAELEKLKSDITLMNASWGICIIDNATGEIIIDKDKNRSLIPASSTKTITTSTALALLGEDYAYNTSVFYSGKIENHILSGDIIVMGSGDPTIASTKIDNAISESMFIGSIIEMLRNLDIQKIEGRVIVDVSCFDGFPSPQTWNWSDIGNNYGAGTFGFNFEDNEFAVQCNPTQLNKAPTIAISPLIPSIQLKNNFYCSDTVVDDEYAYVFGEAYDFTRILSGPVPLKSSIIVKASMPDPALYFAQLLTEAIAKQGISISKLPATNLSLVEEGITYSSAASKKLCFTYKSLSLAEICKATNQKSLNLYAESILKTIAKEQSSTATAESGLKIIHDYWTSKGIDLTGFYMKDGSGLSRHNAISPNHFAQIMYAISKEKYHDAFFHSLAVAGQSGTLKNLCLGTAAAGKIIAKSGTVERAISYTGYVKSSSGKNLSFSMIFNNYTCTNAVLRKKIEQLMVYMSKI